MPAVKRAKVKCPQCDIYFYRDEEENVCIKHRYWHKQCYDGYLNDESSSYRSIEELNVYIKNLFSMDYVPARIHKQIKDMVENYNYSYSGILGTLKYWFEIKSNSLEKANNGIGIVPFVYEDAKKYYESIFYASQLNKDIGIVINEKRKIIIKSPRIERYIFKTIDLDKLEERFDKDD